MGLLPQRLAADQERPGHAVPVPGATKAHPGYPGYGPPPPGPQLPEGVTALSRSPPAADKYLPEWNSRNYQNGHLAEVERLAAERLLQETKDLITNVVHKTRADKVEVDTRFKQRVGDIAFWKSELENKLADLKLEVEAVEAQNVRLEHAIGACREPLGVTEQCLAHRNQRQGVDSCDDNVQKHLQLEAATIQGVRSTLQQALLRSTDELRRLTKTKGDIERDLVDKEAAMDIDQQTSRTKVTAPLTKRTTMTASTTSTRAAGANKNAFSTRDWQEYTEHNIELAKAAIRSALSLQSTVDVILAKNAANLRTQKDLTDRALARRIGEYRVAKDLIEQQLSETVVKVSEMDENIKALEKAIASKQGPLATCHQKIQQRKARPNIEHVSDQVESQLHQEARNLVEGINKLELCLAKSKASYAALQRTRLELEAQRDIKANSIYIDEVKCLSLRQGVEHQAY